jgi:septum site-determining protein MinC
MRGRALAGVRGDKEAIIYCRSLEAELVSIAGQYRLSEDLKEGNWKQSVCISLQDDRLEIREV